MYNKSKCSCEFGFEASVCFHQTDDRQVASDAFTLNFMSVLQQLCVKVKMDKVCGLSFYIQSKKM
mgnify:CR=1 FL=1